MARAGRTIDIGGAARTFNTALRHQAGAAGDRAARQHPDRRRHGGAHLVAASREARTFRRGVSRRPQPRLGRFAAERQARRPRTAEGTDDAAFIVRLAEEFIADGVADPKRIYVTGLSNGGAMTMTMICARADLFAAAASVIMNLTDESAAACHPSRPVPLLMMNGTADPLDSLSGRTRHQPFCGRRLLVDRQDARRSGAAPMAAKAEDAAAADLEDRDKTDQTTVTRISSNCPPAATSCFTASTTAATACPAVFSDARFPRVVN